jgi:vacuolar-type H+-ATPase subunit I/STV1
MPKVNFVKAARKDVPNTDIKAGESYYWWQGFKKPKRFSKTPPKPSEVVGSAFLQTLYGIDEGLNSLSTCEDILDGLEEAISSLEELKDEVQGNLDNMPEGLQQGNTGQMMQERIDALESYISELEEVKNQAEENRPQEAEPESKEEKKEEADDEEETQEEKDEACFTELQNIIGGHGL